VSACDLFLLLYVGITGLLSASVFGLLIVKVGDTCCVGYREAGSIPEELLHGQGWISSFFYCYCFGFITSCSINLFVVSKIK
jgi:hypothetical protein